MFFKKLFLKLFIFNSYKLLWLLYSSLTVIYKLLLSLKSNATSASKLTSKRLLFHIFKKKLFFI